MDARKSTMDASEDDDFILTDKSEIADQEARNGLLQFDEVNRLTNLYAPEMRFEATTEMICRLNEIAIQGVRYSAGKLRTVPINITNTSHVPPPYGDVPEHMVAMCDYVNHSWDELSEPVEKAIHVSAYLMWRLNWIHPFRDGNGRTSRAVSYLALGVGLGRELIGSPTIADQIVDSKTLYYRALDSADAAWSAGEVNVSDMESLIEELLSRQLSADAN